MIDHSLSDELVAYQDLTRRFVLQELRPYEEEVERNDHIPEDLRRQLRHKAAEVGLFAFNMPEEVGGPGLSYLAQVVIREQLGHVSVALADLVGRPAKALLACTPQQRERFLAPAVRGDAVCAFALTEPGAGSDAGAMSTRAVRDEAAGGWRISGTKHFISHGDIADFMILISRAGTAEQPLHTAFLVERGTPGLTVGRVHRKMGWRGYPIAELAFDEMFIPDEQVLGKPGDGMRLALRNINEARLGVASHCLGMAQRAFDYALEHVKQRRQFGRAIGAFQGPQWMLADMALQLEQSRALVYAAARTLDAASSAPAARSAVSLAKLSATEMAGRVTDAALQLMGGAGFMAEGPIEMIYRDARAFRLGEGTSEIQRNQIARALLGPEMFE